MEFWQELYDMNHKAESDLDGSITKADFNGKIVISDAFVVMLSSNLVFMSLRRSWALVI